MDEEHIPSKESLELAKNLCQYLDESGTDMKTGLEAIMSVLVGLFVSQEFKIRHVDLVLRDLKENFLRISDEFAEFKKIKGSEG